MSKQILIDAVYPREVRVVVHDQDRLVEYETESDVKRPIKGNIYLAKITRVEASLQAAFVDYGADRHGFLPFSDIHPDYFQLPIEDSEILKKEMEAEEEAARTKQAEIDAKEEEEYLKTQGQASESEEEEEVSTDTIDEMETEEESFSGRTKRKTLHSKYSIQEVIKRGQVVLVQALKEERGNKGASLTTYISLAGRSCVLMPNSSHQGGISRRIQNYEDRRRLKQMIASLELPKGTSVIIRTAGLHREQSEIQRDYEYLVRLWDLIRKHTMESTAPAFIHAEGDLIKRTIRDTFDHAVEEIWIEGDQAYRSAKDFMKLLMPKYVGKVKQYRGKVPLFTRYHVEEKLMQLYEPEVQLESGGYIVLHPTEALVSVDVNSGKATSERNVEETAVKTNIEAARGIAKQLQMRDLSGLIVIDFIDMSDFKNRRLVERELRDALRSDRARIQMGRISPFGLLEMSRQRLRTNLVEMNAETCQHCHGSGHVRSSEAASIMVLRQIAWEVSRHKQTDILEVSACSSVVLYFLNSQRDEVSALENRYNVQIVWKIDEKIEAGKCRVERKRKSKAGKPVAYALTDASEVVLPEEEEENTTTEESSQQPSGRRKWQQSEGQSQEAHREGGKKRRSRNRNNRRSNQHNRPSKGKVEQKTAASLVKGFIKKLVK